MPVRPCALGSGECGLVLGQCALRLLREIRSTQAASDDVEGIKKRQRRMHRLQQALTIGNNVRAKRR